nr:uncharacterized protein LOC123762148 [Procambarus clarkii]
MDVYLGNVTITSITASSSAPVEWVRCTVAGKFSVLHDGSKLLVEKLKVALAAQALAASLQIVVVVLVMVIMILVVVVVAALLYHIDILRRKPIPVVETEVRPNTPVEEHVYEDWDTVRMRDDARASAHVSENSLYMDYQETRKQL